MWMYRTGIAAGSPIPTPLMKKLVEKLNLTELTIAYGMSASPVFLISPSSDTLSDHLFPIAETSPVTFQTTADDPLHKRVETVGKVQPHTEAKIVHCGTASVRFAGGPALTRNCRRQGGQYVCENNRG